MRVTSLAAAVAGLVVVLAQPAHADVRYSLSVNALPESTWWGSFALFTPEFITAPITFDPSEMWLCTVVNPGGQHCLSATFDPQGSGPDKVSFATTAGTIDLLFADGWFLQNGGMASVGNTGSLFISGVPEPSITWLLSAGLLSVGAAVRARRTAA